MDVRRTAGLVSVLLVAGCTSAQSTSDASASPSAFWSPPVPSTPVSSPVASPPESRSAQPIPADIPASAFLQESDAPGKARQKPKRADHDLPTFCDKAYEQKSQIGVRASQLLLIQSRGDTEGSTPKSAVYEHVIVYRGDGARNFMRDLRKAVKSCASDDDDKNLLRGSINAGDDSELIEQSSPATDDAGEPVKGQTSQLFWAAVRHDDTIAFVSNTGWESGGAEKGDTITLGTRAAARVEQWRS